jgi:hypothetical protein
MSDPKAATQSGPKISSRASRRCMQAVRRCTSPDRSFTARLGRITGPVGGLWVEAIWVQQRQPSQQLGVQPVGLGVLGASRRAGPPTARRAPARRSRRAVGTMRPAAPKRYGSVPSPPAPRWRRRAVGPRGLRVPQHAYGIGGQTTRSCRSGPHKPPDAQPGTRYRSPNEPAPAAPPGRGSLTAAVTTAGGEHQTFAIRDHQLPIPAVVSSGS